MRLFVGVERNLLLASMLVFCGCKLNLGFSSDLAVGLSSNLAPRLDLGDLSCSFVLSFTL